ncbi:serine/threonine-protein kinase [Tumebacillus sp. BK434]|uniref:protein kinase domain-containing protein n=1 Tax=Tumebacillus sp. BK434 TaxID=2512169 RepID=UPI0010EF4E81|nr:protein kinase [Tumebacillus sp. BK434]TCP57676.1 serine/threonine-protein kinase [Tumebacillus sp. BK434]
MATWQPTSFEPLFRTGSTITGVWNKQRYLVESMLGRGANGEVYRVVKPNGERLALKVSPQSSDIALEHKILHQLQGVARGIDLGPLVFDLDDADTPRGKAFFYVMEQVHGTSLPPFLKKRGGHWLPVLLLQLCTYLERMHKLGFCFGDLKAENCLVDEKRGRLRLVDFGGVTPFGRGVKEYTEWYDRAWWGQGSRRADESYDVFALTMMAVALLAPDLRHKLALLTVPNFSLLQQSVRADPRLAPWRDLLGAVWSGRVTTVERFRERLMPMVKASVQQEQRAADAAPRQDWSDWLLLGSAAVLVGAVCLIFL